MKAATCPINDYLKVARTTLPHSLSKFGECCWQVGQFGNRCPQIQHQFTPFEHHLVGLLQGFFKDSPHRLVFTELRRRGMETQQQTLDSLKKSVVQLARDTLSLLQSRCEMLVQPRGCLPQPEPIQRPQDSSRRR